MKENLIFSCIDNGSYLNKIVFCFAAAARIITKNSMRKHLIDKLQAGREADIKNFVDFMMRDSVQKMLKQYIEMLKKKAEAKAKK